MAAASTVRGRSPPAPVPSPRPRSSRAAAVVPLENSVSGMLQNVLLKLIETSSLHIVGETIVAEEHCLCVQPGSKEADIRTVMSHPHLLMQ